MSGTTASIPIPPELFTAACVVYFGHHPVDVVSPAEWLSKTLEELGALFGAISQEAEKREANSHHIKLLADLGRYVASDFANMGNGEHKRMTDDMKKAGIPID